MSLLSFSIVVLFILAVLVASAWGWVKVFQTFNSPDGERYRRLKMQGPFVPLSQEDIEEDERRLQARRAGPHSPRNGTGRSLPPA